MGPTDWQTRPSADGRAIRATSALPFRAFVDGLAADPALRAAFTERLRAVPFAAYAWEVPPLVPAALDRPFECAFVDVPLLARLRPDRLPFAEHFAEGGLVTAFASLGGDAWLVAPCPGPADDAVYAHLAAFVRGAPAAQIDLLWRVVGEAARARLGPRPLWLSTAGLGVSWLHVRLDERPKYYRTSAYLDPP